MGSCASVRRNSSSLKNDTERNPVEDPVNCVSGDEVVKVLDEN